MANKKRRCTYCKTYKEASKGISTPFGFFCGDSCRYDLAMKQTKSLLLKSKAITKKKADKEFKERKAKFNLNDVPRQHNLTQTVFNRMRVLQEVKWFKDRGLEPECISCGKTNMDFCCGHFKSRGAQGNLRYDVKNTFLQCNRYCNMALSGNIEGNKNTRGYKVGLVERFGKKEAEYIINYCEENTQVKKWTGPELQELRASFSIMIKELETHQ